MFAIETKRGWVKEDPSHRLGWSVGTESERYLFNLESEAYAVREKLNAGYVVQVSPPVFMLGGVR